MNISFQIKIGNSKLVMNQRRIDDATEKDPIGQVLGLSIVVLGFTLIVSCGIMSADSFGEY